MENTYLNYNQINEEAEYQHLISETVEKMNENQKKNFKVILKSIQTFDVIRLDTLLYLLKFPCENEYKTKVIIAFIRDNAELEWYKFLDVIESKELDQQMKECMFNELYKTYSKDIPAEDVETYLDGSMSVLDMINYRKELKSEDQQEEIVKQLKEVSTMAAEISSQAKDCNLIKEKVKKRMEENIEINKQIGSLQEELSKARKQADFYRQSAKKTEEKYVQIKNQNITLQMEIATLQEKLKNKILPETVSTVSVDNNKILQELDKLLKTTESMKASVDGLVNKIPVEIENEEEGNDVENSDAVWDDLIQNQQIQEEEMSENEEPFRIENMEYDDSEEVVAPDFEEPEIKFQALNEEDDVSAAQEQEMEENRDNFYKKFVRKYDRKRFEKLGEKEKTSTIISLMKKQKWDQESTQRIIKDIAEGKDLYELYQIVKENKDMNLETA